MTADDHRVPQTGSEFMKSIAVAIQERDKLRQENAQLRTQLERLKADSKLPRVEEVQLVYEISGLRGQFSEQLKPTIELLTKIKERFRYSDNELFNSTVAELTRLTEIEITYP